MTATTELVEVTQEEELAAKALLHARWEGLSDEAFVGLFSEAFARHADAILQRAAEAIEQSGAVREWSIYHAKIVRELRGGALSTRSPAPEQVEVVARAISKAEGHNPDALMAVVHSGPNMTSTPARPYHWETRVKLAEAAIAALGGSPR